MFWYLLFELFLQSSYLGSFFLLFIRLKWIKVWSLIKIQLLINLFRSFISLVHWVLQLFLNDRSIVRFNFNLSQWHLRLLKVLSIIQVSTLFHILQQLIHLFVIKLLLLISILFLLSSQTFSLCVLSTLFLVFL
jgi:hypothetical protein